MSSLLPNSPQPQFDRHLPTHWQDYILGENIERLILTATAANGTGNELANILTGNSANNILDGGIGADTIVGGAGNDTLDGGADNDTLEGGAGKDTIKGNTSNNILTGGAGADAFIFGGNNAISLVAIGMDTITDFTVNVDKILLSKSTFKLAATSGSPLQAGELSIVTSDLDAGNNTAGIVYNSINGKLFYNENGNAGGLGTNGGQFAQLAAGLSLTANDFNAIV